ncbi:YCF48-related protein [Rurimicrobium arvi]
MRKTKNVIALLLTVLCGNAVSAQWKKIGSGTTNDLLGVHFPTASTGYAVGKDGTVLKSTDGGDTWTGGTVTGYTTNWFWDVQFKGADTGFVCGETDPGTNPHGMGLILKTTDGGKTWKSVFFSSLTPVRDIFMVSRDTIFACGGAEMTDGYIWKSVDGGSNWTPYGPGYYDAMLGGLYFLNGSKGFWGMYESVGGAYNPGLSSWMSTKDGLATINTDVAPSSASYWNFASSFPTASRGYMMRGTYLTTGNAYVRVTNDGGATWTEKYAAIVGAVYGMDFCQKDTGFIVGGAGKIWRTGDGAFSWSAQSSPVTTDLRSVYCYKNEAAYAVGTEGTILKLKLSGMSQPSAITENKVSETISVGPNPVKGLLTIYGLTENMAFSVTDLRGVRVAEGMLNPAHAFIDMKTLAPGMYLLHVQGTEAMTTISVCKAD